MSFFECEFPREIAFQASGGPSFYTQINTGLSGFEQRNRNWAAARAKWKIELAYKDRAYFPKVLDFWLNAGGMADAFRFLDHKDNAATGQQIGTGDGATTEFQLIKTYTTGSRTYTRTIKKPITTAVQKYDGSACTETVNVYKNGVLQLSGVTVDETTGVVTFSSAPAIGVVITADFSF